MDRRLELLMESHPNYQNFTANDFRSLRDAELRGIIAAFAVKLESEVLIPQSFVRAYGENAGSEFMLAVQREATRRGQPEMYAIAALNGGVGNASGARVDSNVPATVQLADGTTATSTAPRILNFQVAQDALKVIARNEAMRKAGTYTPQTSFQVSIPQSAIAAVVAAYPQLPQTLARQGFKLTAGDELAYMSGYATRAGATRDIAAVTMDYPQSAICAIPTVTAQVANPNKPDVDAGLAWAAGYIQSDVDQMPASQRNAALAACTPRSSVRR